MRIHTDKFCLHPTATIRSRVLRLAIGRKESSALANSSSPIAIVLLGANWAAYSSTPLSFAEKQIRIGEILDELGAAGKQVFLIAELPMSGSAGAMGAHYALHQWLSSASGAQLNRPFVSTIDVWDYFVDPSQPGANIPNPKYFYDGLHLTPAGNQLLGQLVAARIDPFVSGDGLHLPTSNTDLYSPTNTDGVLVSIR